MKCATLSAQLDTSSTNNGDRQHIIVLFKTASHHIVHVSHALCPVIKAVTVKLTLTSNSP